MGDVVNLNRHRKMRRKAEREVEAAENRVRFGRTRAEKDGLRGERTRQARALDGKKRED